MKELVKFHNLYPATCLPSLVIFLLDDFKVKTNNQHWPAAINKSLFTSKYGPAKSWPTILPTLFAYADQ